MARVDAMTIKNFGQARTTESLTAATVVWIATCLVQCPSRLLTIAGIQKDWIVNADGQVSSKKQVLADVKGKTLKFESIALSDMKPILLGETAIVSGLDTEKSSNRGKDTSGKYRWTDTFVKRDGRWQCVVTNSTKMS